MRKISEIPLPEEGASMLDWALYYAAQGLAVFPVYPKTKDRYYRYDDRLGRPTEKYPEGTPYSWKAQADTDLDRVRMYWTDHPNANIGCATGSRSGGLFNLDLDQEHINERADGTKTLVSDGWERLKKWERETGLKIPDGTWMSKTGRGGNQLFFKDESSLLTGRGGAADIFHDDSGCDTRGEGNCCILPPSIHPNGNRYEWEQSPDEYPLLPVDEAVKKYWSGSGASNQSGERKDIPRSFDELRNVKSGRHDALKSYLASVFAKNPRLPREALEAILKEANNALPVPIGTAADDDADEYEKTVLPLVQFLLNKESEKPHAPEVNDNAGGQGQGQAPALPIKLSNIEKKKPEWLVPGYIPLNAVTLIAADGGAGKTSIETSITAAVSTGTRPFLLGFPTVAEKERGETGSGANVLFLSGEDFAAYTLREKIEAAGGDGERVFIVDPTNPNIKQYCFGGDLLGKAIEEINPRLVVIDPLQSFLHEDVNMIARNQMRQAMIPVAKLAEEKNLSVLIAVHSNKRDAASGRNRVSDSSDIWDMARSVLMVGQTGEGNIRYISHEKSNWGALSKTALFRISKDGIVEFLRYEDKKDADYQCEKRTQRTQERDAPKRKDAEEFILDVLKDAEENILSAGDLKSMARDEGISDATYREARKVLEKNHQIKRQQEGRGKSKGVKVYYQLADGFNIHALELDPAADTPPDRPDTEGQLEEKP